MDTKNIKSKLTETFNNVVAEKKDTWEVADELYPIYNELAVDRKKYSRPVRVYCDIDGIISPLPEFSPEDLEAHYDQKLTLSEDHIINKDKIIKKTVEIPQRYNFDLTRPLFMEETATYSPEAIEITKKRFIIGNMNNLKLKPRLKH